MEVNKSSNKNSTQMSEDKEMLIKPKPEGKHITIVRYYFIMFLFGIAVLIPTSTLLTSLDYFIVRFPKYQPGFVIPLALNAPLFLFMVVGLFVKWFSLLFRAVFGFIGIIVCLIAIPLVADNLEQDVGWIVLIIVICVMGVCASISE